MFSNNKTVISLFLLALAAQIALYFAIPIGFECDAGMYFNYARKLINSGGAFTDGRPPLFPLFLLLTGQVWPGTLFLTIFLQLLIGIVCPLILYKILLPYGRLIALTSSILMIISCVSFVGSKLILAEQFYSFFLFLSIFSLSKIKFNKLNYNYIKYFFIFAICATLTRFEGQLFLFFGTILISFYFIKNKMYAKSLLPIIALISFVLIYSLVRSVILHDFRVIGYIQNSFGNQLFNRLYSLSYVDTDNNYQNMIALDNGPVTIQVTNLLKVIIIENPDSYRSIKKGLNDTDKANNVQEGKTYQELFGNYEGNPSALVENMFNTKKTFATMQYVFFIPRILTERLGVVEADKLLYKLAFESIRKHYNKLLGYLVVGEGSFFGLRLDNFKKLLDGDVTDMPLGNKEPSVPLNLFYFIDKHNGFISDFNMIYSQYALIHTNFDYSRTGYNAGSCAENVMSKNMWDEYNYDKSLTDSEYSLNTIKYISISRSYVRLFCGLILLLGILFIFYPTKRIFFNITLFVYFIVNTLVIVLSSAGSGSRYDIAMLPVLIILYAVSFSNILLFFKYLKNNIYKLVNSSSKRNALE